jgi:hypothetical protein
MHQTREVESGGFEGESETACTVRKYHTVLHTLPPAPSSGVTRIHTGPATSFSHTRGFSRWERVRVWLGGPCYCHAGPHRRTIQYAHRRREAQRGGGQTRRVKRSQRQQLRGRTAGSRETERKRDRHRITLQARCYPQPWNAIDDIDANSASRWTGGVRGSAGAQGPAIVWAPWRRGSSGWGWAR